MSMAVESPVQIEIIHPDGVSLHAPLTSGRGIANIGRHPANEIRLEGPDIADFHALLDYSNHDLSLRLIVMSERSPVRRQGQPVAPNQPLQLGDQEVLELGGYTLVVRRTSTNGAPVQVASTPMRPAPLTPPTQDAPPTNRDGTVSQGNIEVELLSEREQRVDVEKSARWDLQIKNKGSNVVGGGLAVTGWNGEGQLILTPRAFNLNPGNSQSVNLTIQPERSIRNLAGLYPLTLQVGKGGAQQDLTLVINPYRALKVSSLVPSKPECRSRRPAFVIFEMQNQGNTEEKLQVEGYELDKQACTVEFAPPEPEFRQNDNAKPPLPAPQERAGNTPSDASSTPVWLSIREFTLAPGAAVKVRARVTPKLSHRIGNRGRTYTLAFTVKPQKGDLIAKEAKLTQRPWIGVIPALICLLLVGALTLYFSRPQIRKFELVSVPTAEALVAGKPGRLEYSTFGWHSAPQLEKIPTTNPTSIPIPTQPISSQTLRFWSGQSIEFPVEESVTYQLTIRNWIGRLGGWVGRLPPIRFLGVATEEITFKGARAAQNQPNLEAEPTLVVAGEQSVTLRWQPVVGATEYQLWGNETRLMTSTIDITEYSHAPEVNTDYQLIVIREGDPPSSASELAQVRVIQPTPIIEIFRVDPEVAVQGENVMIVSRVLSGAKSISTTDRITLASELSPPIQLSPVASVAIQIPLTQPGGASRLQLVAENSNPPSTPGIATRVITLTIVTPTPTPIPTLIPTPEIKKFEANPKEVVLGGEVRIGWEVHGAREVFVTPFRGPMPHSGERILPLHTPGVRKIALLAQTGPVTAPVVAEQVVEVNVVTATPTATPTPTATHTPTPTKPPEPTPLPASPAIDFFRVESAANPPNPLAILSVRDVNGVATYSVYTGTQLALVWQTRNAAKVTLDGEERNANETLFMTATETKTYLLMAETPGAKPDKAQASIAIVVIPLEEPPPPPSSVMIDSDNPGNQPVMIWWTYAAEDLSKIVGFRVYKTALGSLDATPISPIIEPTDGQTNFDWTDETDTCGKAYFVVTVYEDPATRAVVETDASPTSQYTMPCS